MYFNSSRNTIHNMRPSLLIELSKVLNGKRLHAATRAGTGNATACGTNTTTVVLSYRGDFWNVQQYDAGAPINIASDGTESLFPNQTCGSFPGTLRLIVDNQVNASNFVQPNFNATLFTIGIGNISSAGRHPTQPPSQQSYYLLVWYVMHGIGTSIVADPTSGGRNLI